MGDNITNLFNDPEFGDPGFPGIPDDFFSLFDTLEGFCDRDITPKSTRVFSETEGEGEGEGDKPNKRKRVKITDIDEETRSIEGGEGEGEGNKVSHITVERNRRKQMNEHLTVLRSLMPCFYVKRGDQASIIGGVVDYINELQQVLNSLEAKKQRKAIYSDHVLSPRVGSSPRPSQPVVSPRVGSSPRPSQPVVSPRKPPLSPRINLPISPTTPQPGSPYNNRPRINLLLSPTTTCTPIDLSPSSSSNSSLNYDCFSNELLANSKSLVAEVEVKFSGPNLLLKTVSPRIPGQVVKIISVLHHLCLEILQISISTIEDMMLNSFTIKIGIECQLSAEELAHQIQQTFCSSPLLN